MRWHQRRQFGALILQTVMPELATEYPEKAWVGPNFHSLGIFVLGESWYGDFAKDVVTDDAYIQAYLADKVVDPLYTRIANGAGMNKQTFWRSVMFTNYVQRVGPTREHRPTQADYLSAASRLKGLLTEHSPRGVWILGVEQSHHSAPIVRTAKIPVEVVAHPSSYGVRHATLRASWEALIAKISSTSAAHAVPADARRYGSTAARSSQSNLRGQTVATHSVPKSTSKIKRSLAEHALSIVDVLANRRSQSGQIATMTSVEMLNALKHDARAGKNLGNAVSLLDAACLTANVPWVGRLIVFRTAADDFVGPWASWAPFKPYIVEHAPRQRRWSDEDINKIRDVLPSLPANPESWWNEQLHECDTWLLAALRVILQQACGDPNAS